MKIISQLAIILLLFALGQLIVYITRINFPGSIIGMLLLITAFQTKILKEDSIKDVANFFLNNMMIFFIPLGVGLIDQWKLISEEWLPISISTIISTFVVFSAVALIIQKRDD